MPTGPTPTDTVPPSPLPLPTPHPGNGDWVRQRIDAVIALYEPTPAGQALLHSLDVRQMPSEPGFFGSYGFRGWAGVGEAKPIPIMHELGHSYWGGFPVIGRPEVGWARGDDDQSSALAAYHRDILTFMAQPPDDYELFRQRLRNLPGLSVENTEPLFHSMEADVVYATGGDLALVPPVLRKYWAHFLTEGPFWSWHNAAAWLQSLNGDERDMAGKYLGLAHLDLRQYPGLAPYQLPGETLTSARRTLADEERQRLRDFAANFDLLLGDAQLEENFQFWRDYLRDKLALYRDHPEHLKSLEIERAKQLSAVLETVVQLDGGPEEKASALPALIEQQPLLVNFLPALDDRTLVRLFASSPEFPEGPTLRATASFVERLQRFGGLVEGVIAEGRRSPEAGAEALRLFLDETDLDREQDLKLFFDLFIGTDRGSAREIVNTVDNETIRALMVPVPVKLRVILKPEDLLAKLEVTAEASQADFLQGVLLLTQETSGNFLIDGPFLEELLSVMAVRAKSDPGGVAAVIITVPIILESFIALEPSAAAAVFKADLARAADLVLDSDAVVAPPARIVYRLAGADPELAADVVISLDRTGKGELVAESLAYFAYDKVRSERYSQLPISLARYGAFVEALWRSQGTDWLQGKLSEVVARYETRVAAGEVAGDFLERFRETLLAAVALSIDGREALTSIVSEVFD